MASCACSEPLKGTSCPAQTEEPAARKPQTINKGFAKVEIREANFLAALRPPLGHLLEIADPLCSDCGARIERQTQPTRRLSEEIVAVTLQSMSPA